MKAAVLHAPLDLRLEEQDIPQAGAGEIVLKLNVSGLCPSDVRIFRNGSSRVRFPVTMGHEISGTVHDVGPNVRGICEHDRVNVPADAYCGTCRMCRSGHENLCENVMTFGYNINGAHADYLLLPQRFIERGGLFPLSTDVDHDEATITEPLACSLNTIETLGTKPGKTISIIGDGPMGLLHVGLAKEYGATEIILCGLVDWKLKLGAEFGASSLIDVKNEDPVKMVAARTGGAGADIVIVTVVTPRTITQGLQMASKRGYVSIFGGTPQGITTQLEPNMIHYNETYLTGNSGYTYNQYAKATRIVASHKIPLKKLITHRFELKQIHDAIKAWDDKETSMKIMLTR